MGGDALGRERLEVDSELGQLLVSRLSGIYGLGSYGLRWEREEEASRDDEVYESSSLHEDLGESVLSSSLIPLFLLSVSSLI